MPSFDVETLTECLACGSKAIEVFDTRAALSRCRSCGYIFDNPRPTLGALVDFYSTPVKYDRWLSEEDARAKLWARRLKKMRHTAHPGNLLDIGAGIGQFLSLARGEFEEVFGTEVSSSAVEIAREKYGLRLHHGTLDTLPRPPQSLDNITAFHVLEHVPNPRAVVEKCFSLLRNHGVLVVAVPNDGGSLKSRLRGLLGRLGAKRYHDAIQLGPRRIQLDGSMDEIHLSHFAPGVVRRLLERCRFRVIEESIDPCCIPRDGALGFAQNLWYFGSLVTHALSGKNIDDAIWMVGQKET